MEKHNYKSLFEKFLVILNLAPKSVKNYSSALSGIITKGIHDHIDSNITDIFEINDSKKLIELKEQLFKLEEYASLNDKGKNMYSGSMQRYIELIQTLSLIDPNKKAQKIKTPNLKDLTSYNQYITAIRTKPFILLAGISGTGKSRIVRELAYMSCPPIGKLQANATTPGNYCMIEVKPNWHDSSELLGYASGINNKYIVTPFIKFLVKAMRYPEVPFFVCLDEMNLAPVEQYFAEYLSILETRKENKDSITTGCLISPSIFKKYGDQLFKDLELEVEERDDSGDEFNQLDDIKKELTQSGLCLPQNVIVVGTVNMDDTTHQFSRKVIDRAMTLEMNELNFENMFDEDHRLQYSEKPIDANCFIADSASANHALSFLEDEANPIKNFTIGLMYHIDSILNKTPFRVAYRFQNELVIYLRNLRLFDKEKPLDELLANAVDEMLNMKVLPRIEGDEDLVEKPLKELEKWTNESGYKRSNAKIKEMLERLEHAHYTSYWP